jgi:hypothetical protein
MGNRLSVGGGCPPAHGRRPEAPPALPGTLFGVAVDTQKNQHDAPPVSAGEAVGGAILAGELSISLQDVSHSYYPSCNPGATPASPRHRRRVHSLNKVSDFDDGLDYPQPSIRGSDPEPRRSRADATAGGGWRGDGHRPGGPHRARRFAVLQLQGDGQAVEKLVECTPISWVCSATN